MMEASLSALVLGGSGEIGKQLLRQAVESPLFSKIISVSRRQLQFPEDIAGKIEQHIVDFEDLSKNAEAFEGADVVFCCLGTTRAKAGADGFFKVDHDYIVDSGKIAKEKGVKHFNLVSSTGANKNSWLLYNKTKGLTEEHLIEIGFPRLSIYRPGLLLCKRDESRMLESAAQKLFSTFDVRNKGSVPTEVVARAMISNVGAEKRNDVEILSNTDIVGLGKG